MNWNDAKYFLAVYRSGQMLGASKKLGVSQGTLSRRILDLERSLKVELFIRHSNGCELTDAGLKILPDIEAIESNFLNIQKNTIDIESSLSGTVRIGAPDGFGISFLAPKIVALLERHPNLHIQLVPIQRSFSLSQREADIAVFVGRPLKGRLMAKKLTDYTLGLYAAASYLEKYGTPTKIQDLKQHRLLGYVDDLNANQSLNYVEEFLQGWNSNIEIASSLGQMEAIKSGAGIGILHDFMVVNNDDFIPILPKNKTTRPYWIAWHETQNDVLRIKTVKNYIIECVEANYSLFIKD